MNNDDLEFCPLTVQKLTTHNGLDKVLASFIKGYGDTGDRARLGLFMFHIKPDTYLSRLYRKEFHEIHKYDHLVPCQQELTELINRFGWLKFLQALEWFAVNRLKVYVESGKRKSEHNQLTNLLDKIRALPKWLK